MKTISIGDIHGRDIWKNVDPSKYDKIIFVGDYVDSFTVSNITILNNLLDIIEFKKSFKDKVILLLGNHDIQYILGYSHFGCSGYRPTMYYDLNETFTKNFELFQIAYQIDDILWSHAGVHEGWYKQRYKKEISADSLNELFYITPREDNPLFDVGYRRGGHYDVGGPLWCDKNELSGSPYRKLNQIVGHTRVDRIIRINKHNKEIVFIDTLEGDNPVFYEKEI